MSETAANPVTGPASGEAIEAAISSLLAEPDADAAAEPQRPTSEAQTENPDAGEQSQEADPDPQPTEPPPEPSYRVKVRGEEREVPLRELLNGYSRTEDYRAKTAELAEQRRALEAKQAEITTRAQQLDALLSHAPFDPILEEGNKTDWTRLAQEDPAGYVAKRAAYDARLTVYRQAAEQRQSALIEAQREQLARSHEALKADYPEWADDTKRPETVRKLASVLMDAGFSKEEVNGITDHRVLRVVMDAVRYREGLQQRQAVEAKKVPPQAPQGVMKPGVAGGAKAPSERAKSLVNRALQTHRVDDQVAAALAVLETE